MVANGRGIWTQTFVEQTVDLVACVAGAWPMSEHLSPSLPGRGVEAELAQKSSKRQKSAG